MAVDWIPGEVLRLVLVQEKAIQACWLARLVMTSSVTGGQMKHYGINSDLCDPTSTIPEENSWHTSALLFTVSKMCD